MTVPDRPQRVVLFSNGLTTGGAETQTINLARELLHAGIEVGIVSILPTNAHHDELRRLDIPIHELDRRLGPLSAFLDSVRILRRWSPDLLIAFVFQSVLLGRFAGRIARVPTVISSLRGETYPLARRLLIRGSEFLTAQNVMNSEQTLNRYVTEGLTSTERATVIGNIVDLQRFTDLPTSAEARTQLEMDDDTFVMLCVARLTEQKGHRYLLDALSAAELPAGSSVWLAGTGHLADELLEQATRLDLEQNVRFLGARDDIPLLLAACDVLVLPSLWEGLPNVVMEAMAAERATIATEVDGTPELVIEGSTGLLVQPRDVAALAAAIEQLANDAETRRRLGTAARSQLEELFRPAVLRDRWLSIWTGRMHPNAPGRPVMTGEPTPPVENTLRTAPSARGGWTT